MRSRLSRFRLTPAFPISLIALFVALGGVGYAAATITGGDVKNNSLTSKDIKNKSIKKKDLAFNVTSGIQGPQGAPGAQGPAGTPGAQGDPGVPGGTGATGPQGPGGAVGTSAPGTAFSDLLNPDVVSDQAQVSAGGFTLQATSSGNQCDTVTLLGHPTLEGFQQHVNLTTGNPFSGAVDDREDDEDGVFVTSSDFGMWELIVRTDDGSAAAVFKWTLDEEGPDGGCHFAGEAIGTS
jgi:hypothetical protein